MIIVKNCPCYDLYEDIVHLCCAGLGKGECSSCTDCPIKQVIYKCTHEVENTPRWSESGAFADEILNIFKIEKVEE